MKDLDTSIEQLLEKVLTSLVGKIGALNPGQALVVKVQVGKVERGQLLAPEQIQCTSRELDPEVDFLRAFSTRTANVLSNSGVFKLSELQEKTPLQLLKIRNSGIAVMREIVVVLRVRGWSWPQVDDQFVNKLLVSTKDLLIRQLER